MVQLGAGGAGAAVADALLGHGTTHLTVVDVDVDRAHGLARDAGRPLPDGPRAAPAHRQAAGAAARQPTASCTAPRPAWPTTRVCPSTPDLLHAGLWVADIVYRPLDTALLQAARAAGCRTLDGGHMAVHQAVDAFRLITGIDPDPAACSRHFRTLVARTRTRAFATHQPDRHRPVTSTIPHTRPMPTTASHERPRPGRLASFMGSAVEYYDFFLFGAAAALIFPHVFFPDDDASALVMSFATFGFAYVARPIGAVILGHFGDRVGRQKVLMFTLVLMGLSTFVIGCLPTFDQIGWARSRAAGPVPAAAGPVGGR